MDPVRAAGGRVEPDSRARPSHSAVGPMPGAARCARMPGGAATATRWRTANLMSDDRPSANAKTYWWSSLVNPDGAALPASVAERVAFYERQVRNHRIGTYMLETVLIIGAAAVPVATAFRASLGVIAVLGGVVAALTGLRALIRPGENWTRSAGTLVACQREIAVWSAGSRPYDTKNAVPRLIERVEDLVSQETARWADQRALQSASAPAAQSAAAQSPATPAQPSAPPVGTTP